MKEKNLLFPLVNKFWWLRTKTVVLCILFSISNLLRAEYTYTLADVSPIVQALLGKNQGTLINPSCSYYSNIHQGVGESSYYVSNPWYPTILGGFFVNGPEFPDWSLEGYIPDWSSEWIQKGVYWSGDGRTVRFAPGGFIKVPGQEELFHVSPGVKWKNLTLVGSFGWSQAGYGPASGWWYLTWKNCSNNPIKVRSYNIAGPHSGWNDFSTNTFCSGTERYKYLCYAGNYAPIPSLAYTQEITLNPGEKIREELFYSQADTAFYMVVAAQVDSLAQQTVSVSPSETTTHVGASVEFTASAADKDGISITDDNGGYNWSGSTEVVGATGTGTKKTVTFTTVGTHKVFVSSPGNAKYAASSEATATITVTDTPPAPVNVTIKAKAKVKEAYKAWFEDSNEVSVDVTIP